ncbi:MAG: cob(I)yrinic acid a,c-diamide adenosyltransferase [Hydrogenophilus sp.]|nr:cob(I)yrinic acid a,c-diamide adenosyltransferase [Hydrogenophilus sp.]
MGYRLSKIVTRTGDDGTTGIVGNERLRKDAPRIEAIGNVDELNSALGLLAAESLPPDLMDLTIALQHQLFDLGSELAAPGCSLFTEEHLAAVEAHIERLNAALPPLTEFILPGGTRPAAYAHLARAICRRAERALVRLAADESPSRVRPILYRYLNRLSDLLFILARTLNARAGVSDRLWARPPR